MPPFYMCYAFQKQGKNGGIDSTTQGHLESDVCNRFLSLKSGGEIGIRTLDPVARITVFETAAFDHSAISPR